TDGEHVSINWQAPRTKSNDDPPFRTQVVPYQDAPELAAEKAAKRLNVWFGVNPVNPSTTGRGTAAEITRLAALFAHLDVKPGGCASLEQAHAIVAALSE